jgi:hypothetical protein
MVRVWLSTVMLLIPWVSSTKATPLTPLNVTPHYDNHTASPLPDKVLAEKLRDYEIVFVRGMFGNPGTSLGFINYFEEQERWANQTGIVASTAPIDTQAPVATNAKILRDYLETRTRRVIIMAHSKGGVDTLEALMIYPQLTEKIAGFISIQSPFLGTEAVETVLDSWWERYPVSFYFNWMGGGFEAFEEIAPDVRQAHFLENKNNILNISRQVHWLNVVTQHDGDVSWLIYRQKNNLDSMGLPSDGLVPTRRQFYPHIPAQTIYLSGVDHIDLVSENSSCCRKALDRVRFFKATLALLVASKS